MTATRYASTDASAPVVHGQVGDAIGLIDAIGRTGYGTQPAQGMTKPFTGTNQAVFQWTAGNARYLNIVDDGATTAGAANYARVFMAEAMTAQNTGTGLFPTTAQFATPGIWFVHSNTADAVVRPWWAYGNQKILHIFIATDSSAVTPQMGFLRFGDFTSYVSGDTFNSIISSNSTTTSVMGNAAPYQNSGNGLEVSYATFNALATFICRNWTGVGSSAVVLQDTNRAFNPSFSPTNIPTPIGNNSIQFNGSVSSGAQLVYPNGADSGLYMDRLWLSTSAGTTAVHGEMPGMWCPLHNQPLNHLDTFSGTGNLSGKTFECLRIAGTTTSGQVFMETSNTW